MTFYNGDVFDIGQTINGISKFLYFNYDWYYYSAYYSGLYEYDVDELIKLITDNEFDEIVYVGNIFNMKDENET